MRGRKRQSIQRSTWEIHHEYPDLGRYAGQFAPAKPAVQGRAELSLVSDERGC